MSQGYRLVKSGQSHENDYNQQIIVYEKNVVSLWYHFNWLKIKYKTALASMWKFDVNA